MIAISFLLPFHLLLCIPYSLSGFVNLFSVYVFLNVHFLEVCSKLVADSCKGVYFFFLKSLSTAFHIPNSKYHEVS